MARLKVFRTAIGFHDAYVAASSRKAALAAWGSDKDLFARGAAEEVTDPTLAAAALAEPGLVIRRSRGTAAEQFAALPPDTPRRAKAPTANEDGPATTRARKSRPAAKTPPKPKPPPPPKPNRDALDEAEAALARSKREHADALAKLAEREAALARERRSLEREGADGLRRLTRARDAAQDAYDAAMRRWRG